jgi:cytochrome c-type biogenesis protein CcmH/NrfF
VSDATDSVVLRYADLDWSVYLSWVVAAYAGAARADGHGRKMTLRTLVLFVIPLMLLAIGVVTLLVTKWQRKHIVFRDRKHPAE